MSFRLKATVKKVAFFLALSLLISASACKPEHPPYAYITNQLSNDLSVLDTATQQVIHTIPMGNRPVGIALSQNNNLALSVIQKAKILPC